MRKYLLLLCGLCLGFQLFSQKIVVTDPQKRNAILEEYTGIHCGWCPEGHRISEALQAEYAGRFLAINIHQGGFAVPDTSKGEPDFRTSFGDALAQQAGVQGYPTGTINRMIFPEIDPERMALSRNVWRTAALQVMDMFSPVNVGIRTSFDSVSRQLTVEAEIYYTGEPGSTTNYLNIALLESHVVGYQSDYVQGNHQDYDHKNILRTLITGQWGDTILNAYPGYYWTKTYTFQVPSEWNIHNCDVVAFVTRSHSEIFTGVKAPAVSGLNTGKGEVYIGEFNTPQPEIVQVKASEMAQFDFSLISRLNGNEEFNLELTSDAPQDWTYSYIIQGKEYTGKTSITLNGNTNEQVSIHVTAGNSPAWASFTLSMEAQKYPGNKKTITVYVISGVTDLIVNNAAPWGDGSDTNASVFQSYFEDGLTYAGNQSYAVISSDILLKAYSSQAVEGIDNIYYNVGWSFPSMNDELVAYFENVLKKGGHLMISGQDIGWDNWDANGYGTEITKNFIINYMHASYVDDGNTSNNQLTPAGEELFRNLSSSPIVNRYGKNQDGTPFMYPDQLRVEDGGLAAFYYNGNKNKVAAVRSIGFDYKTFYLGVSLEMIEDASVRNEIMKIVHDWFHGIIKTGTFDDLKANSLVLFPNPAAEFIYVKALNEKGQLYLYNTLGTLVRSIPLKPGLNRVSVTDLERGVYFYRLNSQEETQSGTLMMY